jgi:uncharacterized protein YqgC (DUF456 family)
MIVGLIFGMNGMWWTLIVLLFLIAYAGLIFPAIPDVPFLFGGFVLYHFLIDNRQLGIVFWSITIVVTIALILIDYFAGGYAAQKAGGSKWSIPAAALGVILFFWLSPIGFLIGPIITVFLVEALLMKKPPADALKIAISTLIGFLGGVIVKFFLMSALIIWFLLLVFVF